MYSCICEEVIIDEIIVAQTDRNWGFSLMKIRPKLKWLNSIQLRTLLPNRILYSDQYIMKMYYYDDSKSLPYACH